MIAIYTGEEIRTVETGPTSSEVFKAVRHALDNGFAEPINNNYTSVSKTFTALNVCGIVSFVDEDGINKGLPITWRGAEFSLRGPIVFCGMENHEDGRDFVGLTDKQLEAIKLVMIDEAHH